MMVAANQDGLFVLCDDGRIFHLYRGGWIPVATILQGDPPEFSFRSRRQRASRELATGGTFPVARFSVM